MKKVVAFMIHILTSSGGAFALLALLAAVQKDWTMLFAWLLVAQFVDGIDGPIARHFQVRKTLPNWSGDALDFVIDFITYVFLPAFVLVYADLIPGTLGTIAASIIVMSGGLYFADSRMKTTSKAFRGFPAVWNGVLFYYFIFTPTPGIGFALICLLALAQFIPVEFIHPVRVVRWRWVTMLIVAIWSIFAVKVTMNSMQATSLDQWTLALTGAYFFIIGGLLQILRPQNEAKP